ncbi:MAG: hypothetical protein ACTIDE_10055 [Carnobacterium maltaromaticum]
MEIIKLIKVFIASPSDVKEKRDEIENLIHYWNSLSNSRGEKIFLLPIRWEKNTSSEYKEDLSGQKVINNQILLNSDILIAVFGGSLGQPVDGYESGTVSEIETFYNVNKRGVGVFFENKPCSNDILTNPNYHKVEDYQKELQNEKKGLYKVYEQREILAFLDKEVSIVKNIPLKGEDDYYEMTVSDIFINNRANFFQLEVKIPLNDPAMKHIGGYEKNETHWIADWNKNIDGIKKGDTVKFKIKKISEFYRQGMTHNGEKVYPRNITTSDFKILK